jgi:hypothetical protein
MIPQTPEEAENFRWGEQYVIHQIKKAFEDSETTDEWKAKILSILDKDKYNGT